MEFSLLDDKERWTQSIFGRDEILELSLTGNLGNDPLHVLGDSDLLGRAIKIVLNNAVLCADNAGRVDVELGWCSGPNYTVSRVW